MTELIRNVVIIFVLILSGFWLISLSEDAQREKNDASLEFTELEFENTVLDTSPSEDEEDELSFLEKKRKEIAEKVAEEKIVEPVVEKAEEEVIETEEVVAPPPLIEPILPLSFAEINNTARKSLVNILCLSDGQTGLPSITGSGVIIDEQGVILTNAHIAQLYLFGSYLDSGSVNCTIRTGSPAINTYTAELLYMPPEWIVENGDVLGNAQPKGTGEYDYALLLINGVTKPGATLPKTFPSLSYNVAEAAIEENASVLLASYPAGFISSSHILKSLYAASSVSTIGQLYTFETISIDIFSVGGTIVAQKGSSGGAVINAQSELIGLIVTSTSGETTADRDLRALSLSYINKHFTGAQKVSLSSYLTGDLSAKAFSFNQFIAPGLTNLLKSELN